MTRASRHKKHTKVILAIFLALLVIAGGAYAVRSFHYSDHFLPNTKINETDIANLTVKQANEKLKGAADEQTFDIQDNGQNWQSIKKVDLGLKTDYTKDLEKIKDAQNRWKWGVAYVFADSDDKLDGIAVDQTQLDSAIKTIETQLNDLNKNRTKTKDATLTKGADGFTITPEVEGNSINVAAVVADIKKSVSSNKDNLELTDYTEKPKVTANDTNLQDELNALNKVAQVQANYSINGTDFQIPTETIMDWLEYKDGKVTLNKEKVTNYVTDLGKQYNTSSNPTTFKSTRRGNVTVPDGTLSWTIQTDQEVAALTEQLMKGEDFTRSPIVQGSATADKPLVGNTYIEVDLENQHMWYYKDGTVALETDIVSGKPKTPTPAGVFYVWDKARDETLRGKNDDGTKYASPVDYWMPIDWTGVGIHDSDWQPAYGGDLWKTRGSHGCINTPPDVMAKLYNMVETGTPVLVF
ncbi:L,D-transpeptidase family protein [Enterococcus canintestini]|uniref:L,D-TPase catalytic domain-containing protein n=1 Tax=Enterococcus canintestini TaxID=317010 RepID=A0A267HV60_9ENTE|nr:L,D-transpeptidase family protein [Enterococcus canintestini]PAB01460.1 hypothetical protein AKL21_03115 [Enterococcus canintestini]